MTVFSLHLGAKVIYTISRNVSNKSHTGSVSRIMTPTIKGGRRINVLFSEALPLIDIFFGLAKFTPISCGLFAWS